MGKQSNGMGRQAYPLGSKVPHDKKSKQKPKSRKAINRENKVIITFDPEARREFLTGFHKRKLHRKQEAKDQIEAEERKRKREEKKLRRDVLKARIAEMDEKLDELNGPVAPIEELEVDKEEEEQVQTFKSEDLNITVTTKALDLEEEQAKILKPPSEGVRAAQIRLERALENNKRKEISLKKFNKPRNKRGKREPKNAGPVTKKATGKTSGKARRRRG